MKLNCKPGDLAIVVGGQKSTGRIVQVIRQYETGADVMARDGSTVRLTKGGSKWEIEGYVFYESTCGVLFEAPVAFDNELRPIRPDDSDDETLTWAGKPEKATA